MQKTENLHSKRGQKCKYLENEWEIDNSDSRFGFRSTKYIKYAFFEKIRDKKFFGL